MISIYLDWNVVIQMKNGSHPELFEILKTDRFLKLYSTSHIGDILSSYNGTQEQQELINKDLEFLSELTKDNCLSNDGKEVRLNYYQPKDLFDERINEKDLFTNFSLEKLQATLQGDETIKGLGDAYINSIKSIPLDKSFVDALNNPESAKHLETLFPGLKENPTMEGFFKSFGEMITRMNENEDYKELRKLTQSGLGINRDKIFNSQDPFSIIEKTYKKLNFDPSQYVQKDKYAPDWFDKISNEYLKLDMHGYQEDKINASKGRKETFKNTTDDSFHAAFASLCNFYVSNDSRAYSKTKKVYEKLSLNTLVFKPADFLEYYKTFLFDRPINAEIKIPVTYLSAESFTEESTDEGYIRTYHLPYFVFDFFNKMYVTLDKTKKVNMILMSRFAPTNKKITYQFEIGRLSSKIYQALGNDSDNLGQIKEDEFQAEDWTGRKWDFGDISFRLICPNGHFQLYYDLKDDSEPKKDS
jgi:hypothetical protein